MGKKYEILKNGKCFNIGNHTLYRIKALRSFGSVKKGDIGGFVESERNLSHDGNCWIFREAKVYGDAQVFDNAWITNAAEVSDDAKVFGKAHVFGDALVSDNAMVFNNAEVCGNAHVFGDALVSDNVMVTINATVCGNAHVYDDAWVSDNACVTSNARVFGNATINGDAVITDEASVCGYSTITDNAMVYGNTEIRNTAYIGDDAIVVNAVIEGNASIIGEAEIGKTSDYILLSPIIRNETLLQHSSLSLTFYKSKHGISISGDTRSCYTYGEFIKLLHEKIHDKKLLRRYKKVMRFAKKMIK